jgi:hypothetical protein
VSVLSQEDLFPGEGYQFPESRPKPATNSYRTSADSPFTNKFQHSSAWRAPIPPGISRAMSTMLKTEQMCNRVAANAISAPTPGELRPIHSEIAQRAVNKERTVQLQITEQIRLEQMKDEDYWAAVERDQGAQNAAVQQRHQAQVKEQKRLLAQDYQQQLELHRSNDNEQRELDRLQVEAEQRKIELEQDAEAARQREKREQLRRQHQQFTSLVQQRKDKEAEDRVLFDRQVMEQQAALNEAREARETRARHRRDDRNARSQLLQTKSAAVYSTMKAQEDRKYDISDSELGAKMEAERQRKEEQRRQVEIQRNRDYNAHLRSKDVRMTHVVEQPDFAGNDDDRKKDEDDRWRLINARRVRAVQEQQVEERRNREREETAARRAEAQDQDSMYFLNESEL